MKQEPVAALPLIQEAASGADAEVVGRAVAVSAEHGIGKMKKSLLKEMYDPREIDQMVEVKRCFDPDFLLNAGNIFDAPQAT